MRKPLAAFAGRTDSANPLGELQVTLVKVHHLEDRFGITGEVVRLADCGPECRGDHQIAQLMPELFDVPEGSS